MPNWAIDTSSKPERNKSVVWFFLFSFGFLVFSFQRLGSALSKWELIKSGL